jgi:predicted RNA binding protein YcfA (HicA-like mRNA interferase family)
MNRLPALRPKEVERALLRAGFVEHRQKGSHKVFKKGTLRVVLPYHGKDLKRGTLRAIIEQANLTVEEFLELLRG